MEIDIEITPFEADIILRWSEKTISGGHWGDGDAIFPDEAHLLDRLNLIKHAKPAKFTIRDAEIMYVWMDACCGSLNGGHSLTAEEEHLKNKILVFLPEGFGDSDNT